MINFRFPIIHYKSISLDKIRGFIEDDGTKRIHFATVHRNALRRTHDQPYVGKIILPFDNTINAIIQADIGSDVTLFKSIYNDEYYRHIFSESEFKDFETIIEKYRETVFLRDLLDLSIALSANLDEDDQYSEVGGWEYEAKYKGNKEAEKKLVDVCKNWIQTLPFYKNADCICAMPCSNRGQKSLPRRIVDALDGFENISENVYWESKTSSLKDAKSVEDKLAMLGESNLVIDRNLEGKAVFLLDDLYMSGLSMQYVAMKLKEAGAKWVFGLCLVKSRNNTTR